MQAALAASATDGAPITGLPALSNNTYLAVGAGHDGALPTEGGALILTPSGRILSAALLWQICWPNEGCSDDTHYLTIFIKDRSRLTEDTTIFEHWATLFMNQISSQTIATSFD